MARWILLLAGLAGLALIFGSNDAGLVGLGVLLAFGGLIGYVFALAAARVAAGSRSDIAMLSPEDLAALRQNLARRQGAGAGEAGRDGEA